MLLVVLVGCETKDLCLEPGDTQKQCLFSHVNYKQALLFFLEA